jgi:hypothetical protein
MIPCRSGRRDIEANGDHAAGLRVGRVLWPSARPTIKIETFIVPCLIGRDCVGDLPASNLNEFLPEAPLIAGPKSDARPATMYELTKNAGGPFVFVQI